MTFLDDMWAWDGKAWHQIDTPTPSARAEASVAYDSHRQRVVLFGGHRTENGERIRLGDTWEWDGQLWEQRASDGPPPRNHTSMTYDRGREVIVLFGGHDGERIFGDTWEWDGSTWSRRTGQAPRLRIDNGH
jgi:hypothetical protein